MQAVRLPGEGEAAAREFGFGGGLVDFAAGVGWARDDAADKAEARVVGQGLARRVEQRVLAGATWADHEYQHWWLRVCFGCCEYTSPALRGRGRRAERDG